MLTRIIIKLSGTKLLLKGECNEIIMSNIKLMMHMKDTMQLLRRIKKNLYYQS